MDADASPAITYGNLRKPAKPGLWGMPALPTVGLLVALLLMLVVLKVGGIGLGLAWAVLVLLVGLPLVLPTRDGRNRYQRWLLEQAGRMARRSGQATLVAGPAGHVPDGKCRLPGLLAATELTEHTDAYGAPFALLTNPAAKHHTVVIECHATGNALVDQRQVNSEVAYWGAWLAHLGNETGVDGVSVTIETAPDSGLRLRRAAAAHVADDAPDFGLAVVDEIVRTFPAGSAQIQTRIAVTFSSAAAGAVKARTRQEMAIDIGNRLPGLVSTLRSTGAGTTARACRAQELVDSTRVAYDPTVAVAIEEARNAGGTGLTWDEAGPVYAQENKEVYAHDRAYSMSWHMAEPPRGVFYAESLQRLLAPHRQIARKRVTLLFRPHDAVSAASAVESDLNSLTFTTSQRQRMRARDRAALASATKAAEEEARGAGLVRFGMIVTATVTDPEHLPMAAQTVQALAAPARLRLRPALHNQAAAFAAGLPLGLVLPKHTALPDGLRDAV